MSTPSSATPVSSLTESRLRTMGTRVSSSLNGFIQRSTYKQGPTTRPNHHTEFLLSSFLSRLLSSSPSPTRERSPLSALAMRCADGAGRSYASPCCDWLWTPRSDALRDILAGPEQVWLSLHAGVALAIARGGPVCCGAAWLGIEAYASVLASSCRMYALVATVNPRISGVLRRPP